ncbi:hypothetical protein PVAP13_6KG038235 [Panicum virgatum]|uniref:Uncharacterized protein n=1 Tax=Panicum virgatum TaxID=38727 RepID=A0A8T0R9B3_PANVG|nr:hypothetical protein PVAP13_6KG038235 [Panicum virgatum]
MKFSSQPIRWPGSPQAHSNQPAGARSQSESFSSAATANRGEGPRRQPVHQGGAKPCRAERPASSTSLGAAGAGSCRLSARARRRRVAVAGAAARCPCGAPPRSPGHSFVASGSWGSLGSLLPCRPHHRNF